MADSEFRQIASFALEAEAGQFKSILEENGIPAFIDGANANTMLSYIGTALGGIKLLVHTPTLREPPKSLARELTIQRGPVRRGIVVNAKKTWTPVSKSVGRAAKPVQTLNNLLRQIQTKLTRKLSLLDILL